MAELLKNSLGPDVPVRIADMVEGVFLDFDRESFLQAALNGYGDLELTPRARQISGALAQVLPSDRDRAIDILVESLGSGVGSSELTGVETLFYLPFVFFVADHENASAHNIPWNRECGMRRTRIGRTPIHVDDRLRPR